MDERKTARLQRQISLIGEEACEKLSRSSVLIAGVGGVGGHAADAIARMGVGRIVLVDNDTVSESNINRQMAATYGTVGRLKTEVLAERIASIAPDCEVVSCPVFITADNAADILGDADTDAVIDAVDNVTAKIAMICAAKEQGRYIFSSMGTGNKLDSSRLRFADIYETSGCPLARVMRYELRKRGIKSLDVVFSDEVRSDGKKERTPATVAYMPAIAGLMAAEKVSKFLYSALSEERQRRQSR